MLLRVRRHVDMEEPHLLGKYLGCYHRIVETVDPKTGATVTEVEWDMTDYNKSAVAKYESEDFCSAPLHANVPTPFASKLTPEALDRLLEQEGKLNQTQRASRLMKIRYASRVPTSPDTVKANPRPETQNPKLRNMLIEHETNRNGNGVWFLSGLRSEAFLNLFFWSYDFI